MAAISLPSNLESLPPREKAQVYNDLVSKGFSETQIRNAVESKLGAQSNGDWGALKDLASIVKSTGQAGQGGAFTTNFGDKGSWQFGQGAEYNEKNMIESSGAYFQRGDDVIVSDELFWNPDSPTGEKLAEKIDKTQGADKRAGVVITPYAVFQGKATNQQLLDEVKRSGADFVAIDPYIGFGVPEDQLLAWTQEFVPQLNALGVGVKLVLQDFARTGQEAQTNAYNQKLLQTPGISEFISFGLEDAKDLQGSPDWTTMTGGQQFQQPALNTGAGLLGSTVVPDASTAVAKKAKEVLTSSGRSNDPNYADKIVGTFVDEGKVYNVQGDGSFTTISETPDQVVTTTTFTPEGQEVGTYVDERFKTTNLDRFLEAAAYAALAAGTAAGLGPAGVGLFGTPGAAAAGAGTTNLIRTGSVEDALKAAALAGATAYGLENVFPSDALKAGKTAVDLASSGGTVDSITQTLINQGVSPATARTIAAEALAGSSASQIASDFAGLTLGQGAGSTSLASTTATDPNLVNILGSTASNTGAGLLSNIISTAPAIIPSLSTMAGTPPGQTVTVQGQNLPQTQVTTQDLLAALTPAITGTLPTVTGGGTQTVDVPGTRTVKTDENLISSIIPALTTAAIPGAAQAVTQPTGTQQVEVAAKKETPAIPSLGSTVTAALPALPPGIKAELPKPAQPPEKSIFSPSDILKLIGLLGGAGAGAALSQTGTGTISTPPSDTLIGSTTPQFGPDYYSAVQRYYNAYMPETPRNVATPLQQWYENKFGA